MFVAEGESAERPRRADVFGFLGILYATLYATSIKCHRLPA